MRDPDMVFRAQAAASGLEQAWQRWRAVHGLADEPTPAVSSYVGYSLEEPWGQPRVVFGLAAQDAEQLTVLLDRHDCVGPVHATVITRPGGPELRGRSDRALPVPVPAQRPVRDDRDAPVFRQVAAAAQEAAARGSARAAVAAVVADDWPRTVQDAGPGDGGNAQDWAEPDGDDDWADDDWPGGDRPAEYRTDEDRTQQLDDQAPSYEAGAGQPAGRDAQPADPAPGRDAAEQGPLALAACAARAEAEARIKAAMLESRWSAGLEYPYSGGSFDVTDAAEAGQETIVALPGDAAFSGDHEGSDPPAPAGRDRFGHGDSGDAEFGHGAGHDQAGYHHAGHGAPGHHQAVCDQAGYDPAGHGAPGYDPADYVPDGYPQGGAQDGYPQGGAQDGYPQGGAQDGCGQDGYGQDGGYPRDGYGQDGYGEAVDDQAYDDEADQSALPEQERVRPEHQGPGYARRSRITRGYSIPRLSRTKRSGAVPGA